MHLSCSTRYKDFMIILLLIQYNTVNITEAIKKKKLLKNSRPNSHCKECVCVFGRVHTYLPKFQFLVFSINYSWGEAETRISTGSVSTTDIL